jgi:hypothetical protein
VDEYKWYLKAFGNIVLRISNGETIHTFILDRSELVIDNKTAKLKFNNKHMAGFYTDQIHFILMLEGFLEENYDKNEAKYEIYK